MLNGNYSTYAKSLCHIDLFKGLSSADLERIAATLRPVALPARAPLLFMDEIGLNVYFVLSGTICIYRPQINGGRFILNIVGSGETIGELCAIDEQGHSASALTTEPSQFLRMHRADFQGFVQHLPILNLNFQRLLAARARFTSAHSEALAPYDVERRIARLLIILYDRYHSTEAAEPSTIPLRLTQLELAEMAGSCRQRTSQILKRLRASGCIQTDHHSRIIIVNRQNLLTHCI